MSGDESFLARWSRRKRNVAAQADAEENPPPSAAEIAKTVSPTRGEAPSTNPLAADRIDSIRFRHHGFPRAWRAAGVDARGASPGLDN